MTDVKNRILEYLPFSVSREIKRILLSRVGEIHSLGEIRLCLGRGSSIKSHGERLLLHVEVSASDMSATVNKLCDGGVYAHRDTLSEGFISIEGGVRVGVCGNARYESDRLVGVTDISSLVFRIPSVKCNFTDKLYRAWGEVERGMLIYAPPGGGKTTALRALVDAISSGKESKIVAVVDERCEFFLDECRDNGIHLLRGYKRGIGLEIALRTLSPEVIAVDEIGASKESEEMIDSLNSGVPIIATAHAKRLDELMKRSSLTPFFERNIFDVFVGIFNTDGTLSPKIDKI